MLMLDPRSPKMVFLPGILILLACLKCTLSVLLDVALDVARCILGTSDQLFDSCWSKYSFGDMLDQLSSHSFHCSTVSPCVAAAAASAVASAVIYTCCTCSCTSKKELSELGGVAPGRNRGRSEELAPLRRRGLPSLGLCAPEG